MLKCTQCRSLLNHTCHKWLEDPLMVTIVDNINLLPNPYMEEKDIIILRTTEKEIKKAFPEIFQIKIKLNRERRKRRNKCIPFIKSHTILRSQFKDSLHSPKSPSLVSYLQETEILIEDHSCVHYILNHIYHQ